MAHHDIRCGEVRFLSKAEERAAARRWRKSGDREARELLVQSILPLALKLTERFCNTYQWTDFDEAWSAAQLGALRAVELFCPSKGYRLTTYAGPAIWRRISVAHRGRHLIRVPLNLEICKYRDDAARATAARRFGVDSGQEQEPFDDRADPAELLEADEETLGYRRRLHRALAWLPPRERLVLELRILEGLTLREVGTQLGITRERVRQIQIKAIDRIRKRTERSKATRSKAA